MTGKTYSTPKIKPIPLKTKQSGFFKILYEWLAVGRKWEVIEDWRFVINDGTILLIPKGFIFNGASIPRFLRFIFSPVGLLFIPSVFHDYAYENDYLLEINSKAKVIRHRQGYGRAHWDKMFSKLSTQVNGFSIIGKLARLALIVGGQLIWEKHHGNKVKKRLATVILKITGVLNIVLPIVSLTYLVKNIIEPYL